MSVVLSGGGARGAYEVGVLSYVFGDLAREHPEVAKLDVISGTSVGAVNAAFLAGVADDPTRGMDRLVGLWTKLELADVLQFGMRQALSLHKVLLGGTSAPGIFDAGPLARLVGSGMDWRAIHRNQKLGHLRALTVTATHVASGRPVVFVDRAEGAPLPVGLPSQVVVRPERVLPHHVLASAAIPIIFPPVRIRSDLYCDGGLRLNTPMAPAVHMGVDRLLIVGVSHAAPTPPVLAPGRFPGAPFLLGKILNAFLIDHVNSDLEELERVNRLLEDGASIYGPSFVSAINRKAEERGAAPRRFVRTLVLRPSADIGELASQYLARNRLRFGKLLGRSFLRLLDLGEGASSDLASYLLFDGGFARWLIDLGRQDAARDRERIVGFAHGKRGLSSPPPTAG
ncbi:MAG: patatin-like phospholipase family protein [Polyangiales bacterium]|nr:patatin-like phospholipase family protein [Myxococcales bacterium]